MGCRFPSTSRRETPTDARARACASELLVRMCAQKAARMCVHERCVDMHVESCVDARKDSCGCLRVNAGAMHLFESVRLSASQQEDAWSDDENTFQINKEVDSRPSILDLDLGSSDGDMESSKGENTICGRICGCLCTSRSASVFGPACIRGCACLCGRAYE
eukprot:2378868-Pleurochrysis_carterae.AAC.1